MLTLLGACKKDEAVTPDDGNNGNNGGTPADAPQAMLGRTANMEFTTANTGAPYVLDQKVNFTFASNADLGVDDDPAANDGDELTLPFNAKQGNEYVWNDQGSNHSYVLSLIDDTTINEINVFDLGSNSFLGQFTPIGNDPGPSLVGQYMGSYNVTAVEKGSHTRMTIQIDGDGNIDFDAGVALDANDYALVSDALDCCDGIWVDMAPYPTENYPRVELHMDPSSGELSAVHYYPEYPTVNNRVQVTVSK